ncbi:hypothetical protein [Corynebacterium sp.]|uniref:hypothetical protein n=1 Tax=Corynebacterium sp. TaxID=1720 RepID=UPI0026DC74BE|nr:hypothetical protein [Corynebacterium sp.]MDO5076901.1 hypothetical protein [Corynebacterium sp.]
MKTLRIAIAGIAALATLTACGAGQISQTADQVAAVDGVPAQTDDGKVLVRDVTIVVNDDSSAAVKFTAVNDDTKMTSHSLKKVSVGGTEVTLSDTPAMERNCSIVADAAEYTDMLTETEGVCIKHISTEIKNPGFAVGGHKEVEFTFDNGSVKVEAPIAANLHEAGKEDRVVSDKMESKDAKH